MSFLRALVCILCPPLAVLDKGCGSVLITLLLTCAGWIPGVIAAIIFCKKQQPVMNCLPAGFLFFDGVFFIKLLPGRKDSAFSKTRNQGVNFRLLADLQAEAKAVLINT